MIAGRVGDAAREGPAAGDAEAVRALLDVGAERPQACHQRRDAIALFQAELAGSADRQPAAVRGQRGQGGELVDEAGDLRGMDLDRP